MGKKSLPTTAPAQISSPITTPPPQHQQELLKRGGKPISEFKRGEQPKSKKFKKMNEDSSTSNNGGAEKRSQQRPLLSQVVSDCSKRWFQDTLKEAKAGDMSMQVLVAQMYYCGYGIPKDANKGKIWMTRASRVRSSVWKVSNKRPGYNASDSDSDELTAS